VYVYKDSHVLADMDKSKLFESITLATSIVTNTQSLAWDQVP
jgi:hypothetical protein